MLGHPTTTKRSQSPRNVELWQGSTCIRLEMTSNLLRTNRVLASPRHLSSVTRCYCGFVMHVGIQLLTFMWNIKPT
jgi:hypothetical protein